MKRMRVPRHASRRSEGSSHMINSQPSHKASPKLAAPWHAPAGSVGSSREHSPCTSLKPQSKP